MAKMKHKEQHSDGKLDCVCPWIAREAHLKYDEKLQRDLQDGGLQSKLKAGNTVWGE